MAARTVTTSGFAELDRALGELLPTTAKGAMRGAATEALMPMRDAARANAPDAPPIGQGLVEKIHISTRLSPRTKSKFRREAKSEVVVHMGVAPTTSQAIGQEFGNVKTQPHPYMRPAWDAEADPTLERLKTALGERIMKAAARAGRKATRAAARRG